MNDETRQPRSREALFPRETRSVPAARRFAAQALADWGVACGANQVLLCVSEIMTNALLHGAPPGRGYRLRLSLDAGGVLRAEVYDTGPGLPRQRATAGGGSADEECGRGLLLVSLFAEKWGVTHCSPGKIVWCEFALRQGG